MNQGSAGQLQHQHHEVRSGQCLPASTSKAWVLPVPIATILAKDSIFAKHYNKEIAQNSNAFQKAVLGSM